LNFEINGKGFPALFDSGWHDDVHIEPSQADTQHIKQSPFIGYWPESGHPRYRVNDFKVRGGINYVPTELFTPNYNLLFQNGSVVFKPKHETDIPYKAPRQEPLG